MFLLPLGLRFCFNDCSSKADYTAVKVHSTPETFLTSWSCKLVDSLSCLFNKIRRGEQSKRVLKKLVRLQQRQNQLPSSYIIIIIPRRPLALLTRISSELQTEVIIRRNRMTDSAQIQEATLFSFSHYNEYAIC